MKKNKAADQSKLELFAENTPEAVSSDVQKAESLPACSPEDTSVAAQDVQSAEIICQPIADEMQAEPLLVSADASTEVTVSRKVQFDSQKNKKKLTRNILTYRISMSIFFIITCMIAVVSRNPPTTPPCSAGRTGLPIRCRAKGRMVVISVPFLSTLMPRYFA